MRLGIRINPLEKAHRDISKLTRKVILNKDGHRQTVYVKLGLPIKGKEMSGKAVKKEQTKKTQKNKPNLKAILNDLQKRNLEKEYGWEGGEFGIRVLNESCDGYDKGPGYHLAPSYNWEEDEDGKPSGEELPGTSCILADYKGSSLFDYSGDKVVLVRGYSAGQGNRGNIDPGEVLLDNPIILEVLYDASEKGIGQL